MKNKDKFVNVENQKDSQLNDRDLENVNGGMSTQRDSVKLYWTKDAYGSPVGFETEDQMKKYKKRRNEVLSQQMRQSFKDIITEK